MKKFIVILMVLTLIGTSAVIPSLAEEDPSHILIAYFTWADNTVIEDADASIQSALDHYSNMGDSASGVDATASASLLVPGNTTVMASFIQQHMGGDLFSIQVEEPYPSNYDDCLDRAADELDAEARHFSECPTGGTPVRWPSRVFWKNMIFRERLSFPS